MKAIWGKKYPPKCDDWDLKPGQENSKICVKWKWKGRLLNSWYFLHFILLWPLWIMSSSNNFIPIWSCWQFQSFLIALQIWRLNRETVSWCLNLKSHVRNLCVDFHVCSRVPSTTMFYDQRICCQAKRFSMPLFLLERKPMVLKTSEEVSADANLISHDIV